MTAPEFSRRFARDTIGSAPRPVEIAADDAERAALAARFGLARLDTLTATATLAEVAGGVAASGKLHAALEQLCVVTGEPVPARIDEPFDLRFVEGGEPAAEEVELGKGDLDVLPLEGGVVDLGEAVAQTLGLALDPYPRSPAAMAQTEWRAGPQGGAFAGLKDLLR